MAYGILKCDTVTFTDAGIDKSVTLSGLVQNPTFSGNVTVTGTLSGVTVTGTTANFTSGNFTNISGGTQTIASGVFAAGSAANPSITFTGDLNTGIYSPGADQVAISTSGTGRLFINATGNVGIANSSPTNARLLVGDDLGAITTAARMIQVGHPSGGMLILGKDNTDYSYFTHEASTQTSNWFYRGGAGITLNSAGRVGVGTSSPGYQLHVVSTDTTTPGFFQHIDTTTTLGNSFSTIHRLANDGNNRYSLSAWQVQNDSGLTQRAFIGARAVTGAANYNPLMVFGTTTGSGTYDTRMVIDGSGRVGVGTTTPGQTLSLANAVAPTLGFLRGSTLDMLLSSEAAGAAIQTYNNTPIQFSVASGSSGFSEKVRIDSSGRVGIGTSSPQKTFHVLNPGSTYQADLRLGGTSTYYFDLSHDAGTTGKTIYNAYASAGASHGHQFQVAGTNALLIDSSGRVGIGTTSPGRLLQVSNTSGDPFVSILGAAGNGGGLLFGDNASDAVGQIRYDHSVDAMYFATNSTERARIDSSGRLLVGTSSTRSNFFNSSSFSPGFQIETAGSATASNRFASMTYGENDASGPIFVFAKHRSNTIGNTTVVSAGDQTGRISFQGADGTEFVESAEIRAEVDGTPGANDMPGRLVFSTTADGANSPTERCRIDSTGSFLVGTSNISPAAGAGIKLRFNPNNLLETQISAVVDSSNGATSHLHVYNLNATNNGYRFYVQSNGGIANFQANNANLSDRNAKKDITLAPGTWDCIKEWEIVNYRYKDQPDDADLNLGVIAQQVAESCPEVITVFQGATEDEPQKLGIKEQQMYWMAIKALQEAQIRIEQLEAKVAALESKP